MDIYTIDKPTRCNRPLEFSEAVRAVFKNIVNFQGRSRRSEYWWAMLALYLITLVVYFIVVAIAGLSIGFSAFSDGLSILDNPLAMGLGAGIICGVITIVWLVVAFLLSLSLTIRRLHDTGHSGWLMGGGLLAYVGGLVFMCLATVSNGGLATLLGILTALCFIAWVVLMIFVFVLMLFDSDPYDNQYGPSQKYADDEEAASETVVNDIPEPETAPEEA